MNIQIEREKFNYLNLNITNLNHHYSSIIYILKY